MTDANEPNHQFREIIRSAYQTAEVRALTFERHGDVETREEQYYAALADYIYARSMINADTPSDAMRLAHVKECRKKAIALK